MAVTHSNWRSDPIFIEAKVTVTVDPVDAQMPDDLPALYTAAGEAATAVANEFIEGAVVPGGDATVRVAITHTNESTTDAVRTVGS